MQPLDGNAIAGALYDVYGEDMTMAIGRCAMCGTIGQVAELRVYVKAPGMVARCHACNSVVFVLVEARGRTRMNDVCFELMS